MTDSLDPFANGPFAANNTAASDFPAITQMASVDLLSGASGDALDTNGSPSSAAAMSRASNNSNQFNGEVELLTDRMNAAQLDGISPSSVDNGISKPSSFETKPLSTTIYQLDFDVEHIGKKKPQSKRQATWTYAFPKPNPHTGAIRLEEHETRLTWSTHSGKYSIEVDGQHVFEGVAKGSVLEHKFIYNHTQGSVGDDSSQPGFIRMRIIACRKPPTRSSHNFRCYEFVIGHQVFRDLARYTENNNDDDGEAFYNEDSRDDVGVLSSILDIVDPSWRSAGMA